MFHPVLCWYVLQHFQWVRENSKPLFEELSSWSIFPLFILSGLNSSPIRLNLCPKMYHITFWQNSQPEVPFRSSFSILDEEFKKISSTHNAFSGLCVTLRLCCILVARVEITSYAAMQWERVALYSCRCYIFVCFLHSYQRIYTIPRVMCKHSVL